MKMPASAELGGIYPRSEQLIELTRSYDRGKTERASVEKQIEQDTIELVKLQDESGFENFTDGAFSWQDQLRPTVESLDGVTTGTRYSRWFDTNTFYKKPTVSGKIGLAPFDLKKFIHADLLPVSKPWKVSLVGPYTFSELAENLHYKTQSELVSDLALAEHEIIRRLKAGGVSQFQIAEPCLVYRPYREQTLSNAELEIALAALRRTVDGIGFDLFETDHTRSKIETKKRLALGIVDSRESNVEDPRWIAETATRVSKHIFSDNIVLVPNSDLKFVPRKVADAKLRALAEATRLVEERK